MNHTIDVRMRSKDLVHSIFICDVDLVEGWPLAAKQLNAIERNFGGVVKAVDNDDLVAMFEKRQTRKRPNVTSATARSIVSDCSISERAHGGVIQHSTKLHTALAL
jgi:hypothetical protein